MGQGVGSSFQNYSVYKRRLITHLHQYFYPTGGTDYSKAFIRAFQLLKGSSAGKGSARRKVIVFLTDGQPNDAGKLIMETIKTKNAELNDTVVIMTYGMLQNLQILRDIAKQDGTRYGVPKAPDVTVSTYGIMENSRENKVTSDWSSGHEMDL